MKRVSLFLLGFLIVSLFLPLYQIPEVKAGSGTFGYETKGAASSTPSADRIRGSWFTCSESGTADSVTVYLTQSGGYSPKIKCAIYKKSDDSLIGYTEEWTLTSGWDDWKTFTIISGGSLEATDYYLVVWWNDFVTYWYDVETDKGGYDSEIYNGFPSFWEPSVNSVMMSIFCNYTTEAVGEFSEEFTETIDGSASLYLWKALFQKYIETTTISATSYGWREKASFYTETTTITEQLNQWIELRRFFTESITITETANFAMEILIEITEFTETIGIDASLYLWKAKQFITQETVSPITNFYDWIELKMTIIEFSELIELAATMYLTLPIIPPGEVEVTTFGTLALVIGIIALAIAVTAFAAKTKD